MNQPVLETPPLPNPPPAARWKRLRESDFVRKVAETFSTRILLVVVGLANSMLATRALGPEGRGVFALALTVGALGLQFGNLGLHAANTYTVAREPRNLPALIANSLLVSFVFGTALALGTEWAVTEWRLAEIPPPALLLAVAAIPFSLANLLLQNLFVGLNRVRVVNQSDLAMKIGTALLTGLVIALHSASASALLCVNAALTAGGFVWLLRRILPLADAPLRASKTMARDNLRYGFKAYLAALFSYMVVRSDLFLVQRYLGLTQVGYYSLAVTIADMVTLLPSTLGLLLFPRLSALPTAAERRAFLGKALPGMAALIAVSILFVAVFARGIILLLYGKAFLAAVPALVWLLPGIFALSVNVILMNYFASQGMPNVVVISPLLATLVNIALNVKLIPALGIVGASVSSSIAYTMMLAISLIYIEAQKRQKIV